MTVSYDCSDAAQLLEGLRKARTAIRDGKLVVFPTDTVYGIAADAFNPSAVRALLAAKGRGSSAPPPVLIPTLATLDALGDDVPDLVKSLAQKFWPGGLTIIVNARSSLAWDLGETGGTVALRMPKNAIALELLTETGPLAVSSANLTGMPAATTAVEAAGMLGDSVSIYLDGGSAGSIASTIVDASGLVTSQSAEGYSGTLTILREGIVARGEIVDVVGESVFAQ